MPPFRDVQLFMLDRDLSLALSFDLGAARDPIASRVARDDPFVDELREVQEAAVRRGRFERSREGGPVDLVNEPGRVVAGVG